MTFDEYLEEQLKDPVFRAEYEAPEPEFTITEGNHKTSKTADTSGFFVFWRRR